MKKVRNRLLRIMLIATIVVFAITTLAVSVACYLNVSYDADQMTWVIEKYNDSVPKYDEFNPEDNPANPWISNFAIDKESEFTTRYFIVYLDNNNCPINRNISKISKIDTALANEMAHCAVMQKSKVGYVNKYFRYRVSEDFGSKKIIFLDCEADILSVQNATIIVAFVSIIIIIIINSIFIFASKLAVRPFIENQKKQKQFITDAGHELKTPLAIISANTEILDYKHDDNKEWTDKIKKQIKNLNNLISELLILSKSDELDTRKNFSSFIFDKVFKDEIEPFKEVFDKKNVKVNIDLDSDIQFLGDEKSITRLLSILIENSAKYVPENGTVNFSLHKKLKKVILQVANTDSNIKKIDCERLFDRFYRTDDSRNSKTGGHGIGLSIAKRICESHNGKISAKQQDGFLSITCVFNLK